MATLKLTSPARTGVWIGIATITMSFTAYTSAMVVRQGSGADWQHVALPRILYVNTLLLLLSSGTLEAGRRRLSVAWLSITMALGLLFIAGQVLAWRELASLGVYLATNPASDFFYIFTALHGLHLLGGIVALGYVMVRLRVSRGGPPLAALSAASLYWHFMAVLWLYLLLVLATRL
ncbi:MAG: cytochrome c oxidase subunit 3 [Gemmatimonadales bacterium]